MSRLYTSPSCLIEKIFQVLEAFFPLSGFSRCIQPLRADTAHPTINAVLVAAAIENLDSIPLLAFESLRRKIGNGRESVGLSFTECEPCWQAVSRRTRRARIFLLGALIYISLGCSMLFSIPPGNVYVIPNSYGVCIFHAQNFFQGRYAIPLAVLSSIQLCIIGMK